MNEKEEKEIKVIDADNRIYTLGKQIGKGGQGAVYLVKDDSDIAIKIASDANGEFIKDNATIQEISQRLFDIRKLPIPKNINLSNPLSILKSHAGYVMTFMEGMKSFDTFLKLHEQVKKEDIPKWLQDEKGEPVLDAERWTNFCKTGSTRTRFLALYKVSEILANIHAKGLVYGDISCGNLMYKETPDGITCGLIDTDNINFAGKTKTYFTPGFGAPEITTGKSCATIYSDSYAFAVAAFYILTMMHPYKGKKVLGEDSDADGWSKTVTAQQKADDGNFNDDGSYAWIFDSDDDSNSYGNLEQVTSLFLTPLLLALFDNTFSAGHNKPKLRTPLIRLPKAFAQAADITIKCKSCGMTYFYTNREDGEYRCPYCSAKRSDMILAQTYLKTDLNKSLNIFAHEIGEQEVIIPSRCFYPFKINEGDEHIIGITKRKNSVEFRLIDSGKTIYFDNNGVKEHFVGTYKFNCEEIGDFSITLITENRVVKISGES